MIDFSTSIDRYKIVNRIAQSRNGSLYLAWDPKGNRDVAVKILTEDHPELRERFVREARAVAGIHHPRIVTVFDVGESEGHPFVAMEYVQGQTLATLVRSGVALPIARKLEMVADICEGLAFAHRANVIHHDIKPANVIVEPDGSLKILGFGIARAPRSSTTAPAGTLMGKLNYMSPEQLAGGVADNRSDIWAVGALMYELLSYRQAFPGGLADGILHRVLNESPESLEHLSPGLDSEIPRIVARALAKDARNRYQDMEAMLHDVQATRRRLALDAEPRDRPSEIVTALRAPSKKRTPVPAADPPPPLPDHAPDQESAARQRAQTVETHVQAAERAFAAGDYDAGITACEQALMLDADGARAIELLDHARTVLDEREADQILSVAAEEVTRGALASALSRIDRAQALHPSSPRLAEVRSAAREALAAREGARQRDHAVRTAMERAHEGFDQGLFQEALAAAGEALAMDPELSEAKAVTALCLDAIAAQDRERLDRRAREAVRDARRLFAAGDHASAIDRLAGFDPAHELVAQALDQLRAESERLEAARLESEQQAMRERLAAELSRVRLDIDAKDFAAAQDRLRGLRATVGDSPETVTLAGEADAGLAAQEQAAKIEGEVAAHIARAAGLFARQDSSAALTSIDAALALAPDHKAARTLRAKIEDRLRIAAELREVEERQQRERDQAVATAIETATTATSHQAAIAALGEALDLIPDHPEALQLLEVHRSELAHEQAVRQRRLELETARQGQVQHLLVAARDALGRGDLRAAREAVASIRESDPNHREARSLLDDVEVAEEIRADMTSTGVPSPTDPPLTARPLETDPPAEDRAAVIAHARFERQSMSETEPPPSFDEPADPLSRDALPRQAYLMAGGAVAVFAGVLVIAAAMIGYQLLARGPAARRLSDQPKPTLAPLPPSRPQIQDAAAVPSPEVADSRAAQQNLARQNPVEDASTAPQVATVKRQAQEQLARGEGYRALATISGALKVGRDDGQLSALVNDWLTDARAKLRSAHETATAAGAAARRSSSYRDGVRREDEATRFAREGKSEEAIRAAWVAAGLFDKAAHEARPDSSAGGGTQPPPGPVVQTRVESRSTPLPEASRPGLGRPTGSGDVIVREPGRTTAGRGVDDTVSRVAPAAVSAAAPPQTAASVVTSSPLQPTAPLTTPPPLQPTTPAPAPPPPQPAAAIVAPPSPQPQPTVPAAAPPARSAPAPASEEPAIRATLQAYVDAYSRLEASSVRRVFPQVNEQALIQAFSEYRSQQVQLQVDRIDVSGTSATAFCAWIASVVPRIGSPQRGTARVTLHLQKIGGAWVIVQRQ